MTLSEDLAQDAFIKLWENCKKVPLEKAKSFLFTVANNLFINKANHQKVVFKFNKLSTYTNESEDPHLILQKKEFKLKLEGAIAALPENQREVFLMNRIDKRKYREIAEILGISVKAVEKRMHLALKELRKVHQKI